MSNLTANDYTQALLEMANTIGAAHATPTFDKTVIGEVIQIYDQRPGIYRVKVDNIAFDAKAQYDYKYFQGDQVYVTIVQGDYSGEKRIVGKVNAEDESAFFKTNPFDDIVIKHTISFDGTIIQGNDIVGTTYDLGNTYSTASAEYIGIEFSLYIHQQNVKYDKDIRLECQLMNNSTSIGEPFVISGYELSGNIYQAHPNFHFKIIKDLKTVFDNKGVANLFNKINIKLISNSPFELEDIFQGELYNIYLGGDYQDLPQHKLDIKIALAPNESEESQPLVWNDTSVSASVGDATTLSGGQKIQLQLYWTYLDLITKKYITFNPSSFDNDNKPFEKFPELAQSATITWERKSKHQGEWKQLAGPYTAASEYAYNISDTYVVDIQQLQDGNDKVIGYEHTENSDGDIVEYRAILNINNITSDIVYFENLFKPEDTSGTTSAPADPDPEKTEEIIEDYLENNPIDIDNNETIININNQITTVQSSINDAWKDINTMKKNIEDVDEHSEILKALVNYNPNGDSTSLAGSVAKAGEYEASFTAIAEYKGENGKDGTAGLLLDVNQHGSNISLLAGYDGGIVGLTGDVASSYAQTSVLAGLNTTDENGNTIYGASALINRVTAAASEASLSAQRLNAEIEVLTKTDQTSSDSDKLSTDKFYYYISNDTSNYIQLYKSKQALTIKIDDESVTGANTNFFPETKEKKINNAFLGYDEATGKIPQYGEKTIQEPCIYYIGKPISKYLYYDDSHTLKATINPSTAGLYGGYAGLVAEVSDSESSASLMVERIGQDGKINAASIVASVAEDESAIKLLADNITLKANQIIFSAGDFGGTNLVQSSNTQHDVSEGKQISYILDTSLVSGKKYCISISIQSDLIPTNSYVEIYKSNNNALDGSIGKAYFITQDNVKQTITGILTPSSPVNAIILTFPNASSATVYWVKLEEGTIPSAWSPATGDKVDTSKTSPTMNWIMKPTECVWWNQDGNSTDQYLMKLNKDGLNLRGSLEVTGHLYAGKKSDGSYAVKFAKDLPTTSGEADNMYIAGWGIDFNSLYYNANSGITTAEAFICPTGWNEFSGARITVAGYMHKPDVTPSNSDRINYWALKLGNNFGVSTGGVLHCANAQITNGTLALSDNANKTTELSSNINYMLPGSQGDVIDGSTTTGQGLQIKNTNLYSMGLVGTSQAVQGLCIPQGLTPASDSNLKYYIYCGTTGRSQTSNSNYKSSQLSLMCGNVTESDEVSNNTIITQVARILLLHEGGSSSSRRSTIALSANSITAGGTPISTDSDYNLKNTIASLTTNYSTFFDNLRPVSYKYNDSTSNRLHLGFIAQEVEQALYKSNLTTQDFAGYVYDTSKDRRSLRYSEFIALNTYEIQKLKKRVAELEAQLNI